MDNSSPEENNPGKSASLLINVVYFRHVSTNVSIIFVCVEKIGLKSILRDEDSLESSHPPEFLSLSSSSYEQLIEVKIEGRPTRFV